MRIAGHQTAEVFRLYNVSDAADLPQPAQLLSLCVLGQKAAYSSQQSSIGGLK